MNALADRYDHVVVGAGIAGLLTALRLRRRGRTVVAVESAGVGAGATTQNHGIVHSGAMMARLHSRAGEWCRQAQTLFVDSFADAVATTTETVYYATHERFDEFVAAWRRHGSDWQAVDPDEAVGWLRPEVIKRSGFARVREPIVDTRRILATLLAACHDHGVPVVCGVRVEQVLVESGRVVGVRVGTGQVVSTDSVFVAAGHGSHALLRSLGSSALGGVRSRQAVMAAMPHAGMPTSFMCLDFGGPVIVPVTARLALLGLHGGYQPEVDDARVHAVPAMMVAALTRTTEVHVAEAVLDFDAQVNWLGAKTELIDVRSDAWGTQPGFGVIDHAAVDQVRGLVTVITGKMTLAFHATQAAMRAAGFPNECLEVGGLAGVSAAEVGDRVVPFPWSRLLDDIESPAGSRI